MFTHPAYETVANLVIVISDELHKFAADYDAGEFHGVHDEMPQVKALINRAREIEEEGFDDLDAIQWWLLDVAIIGPRLWD